MDSTRIWQLASAVLVVESLFTWGCGSKSSSHPEDGAGGQGGADTGDQAESAGVCAEFSPCQSDPTGLWQAESICPGTESAGWLLATESDSVSSGTVEYIVMVGLSECEDTATASRSISGTLTVAADGQYDSEFTVSYDVAVEVSKGCADALYNQALAHQESPFRDLTDDEFSELCGDPARFVVDESVYVPVVSLGGVLEHCSRVGDTCRCTASGSTSYAESGRFSTDKASGSDADGDPREYCAEAETLSVYAPERESSGTRTITLSKEPDPDGLGERVIVFRRVADDGAAAGSGGAAAGGADADEPSEALCGNSRLDSGESCDDGNLIMGDGCNGICRIEPNSVCSAPGEPCVSSIECGNGQLDPYEACDDANTEDGDGCAADCTRVESGYRCATPGSLCEESQEPPLAVCGDSLVQAPESCDDGVNNGEYGTCTPGCSLGPHCGDGVVQSPPEHCDDGENGGAYGSCASGCKLGPFCGDGIVWEQYEQCDDGGNEDGDGCSASCRTEPLP